MTEDPEWQKIQRYEEIDIPPTEGESLAEGYKTIIEASKQLTTLNAGSVVVIGTFLKDIFPTEQGTLAVGPLIKGLIASSFVCFGVSLILATFVMIYFARTVNVLIQRAIYEQEGYGRKELQWDPFNRILRLTPFVRENSYDYRMPFYRKVFVRLRRFVMYNVVPRLSLLPLPFFTLGLLCFGTAVVLNLYR